MSTGRGRPFTLGYSTAERRVLILAARGYSNAEIATALFLSVNTIKTHLWRIGRRHGTHGRAGAVALAFARGVLTVDDILGGRAYDGASTHDVPESSQREQHTWP